MNALSKKTLVGAMGAIALAGSLVASSDPAEARSRHGAWIAGGIAAGIVGGALLAHSGAYAAPVYGYAPQCWREARPVFDRWGNVIGYRRMRVCN